MAEQTPLILICVATCSHHMVMPVFGLRSMSRAFAESRCEQKTKPASLASFRSTKRELGYPSTPTVETHTAFRCLDDPLLLASDQIALNTSMGLCIRTLGDRRAAQALAEDDIHPWTPRILVGCLTNELKATAANDLVPLPGLDVVLPHDLVDHEQARR